MAEPTAKTDLNCFGCSPTNPIGLRLVFEESGRGISAPVKLGANYQSFYNVVHGGIVAAILDEILAQVVYRSGQVSVVTTGLRIRYGRPMEIDTEYIAYAEITRRDGTSVRAAGRIELPNGDLVAAADGSFYLLTNDVLGEIDRQLPVELAYALRASNGPSN